MAASKSSVGQERLVEESSAGRADRLIEARLVADLAEQSSRSIHRVVEVIVDCTRSRVAVGVHLVAKYLQQIEPFNKI